VNLQELVNRLAAAGRIKPTRLRAIRSAAKRYAQMLDYDAPQDCPEQAYTLDPARRNELIEEHLKDASAHVLRNVKNNISFVMRQGESLGIIRPPARVAETEPRQFGRRKIGTALPSLMSKQSVAFHRIPYSLPLERWPAHLRQQYEEWLEWVSDPPIETTSYSPKNRAVTVENKTHKFEAFFGYLHNIRGIEELDLRMLLDLGEARPADSPFGDFSPLRQDPDTGLLAEFVKWHRTQRIGRRSSQAREVVSVAASVARRFYSLRAARDGRQDEAQGFDRLADRIGWLREALGDRVATVIPRAQRMASRSDLLRAARAEFPQRRALPVGQSGTELAARAGRAVALMLLVHHPLRNRHYREARLSSNLIKKPDGKWYLHFAGEDVATGRKVASRRKRRGTNNYEAQLDAEVADHLERYLHEWRPILIGRLAERLNRLRAEQAAASGNKSQPELISSLEQCEDYLFLHGRGGPFTRAGFSQWIQAATYRWLGIRVNPQLISQLPDERTSRAKI